MGAQPERSRQPLGVPTMTEAEDRAIRERLARMALERSMRATTREQAERALAACHVHASSYERAYSVDADNGSIIRRYRAAITGGPIDPADALAKLRGEKVERPAVSGATKQLPQPNVTLAHFASKITGGKGKRRRSYEVTHRQERRVYVAPTEDRELGDITGESVRSRQLIAEANAMLAISASYDLVSPSGRTIEALPQGARLRMLGTDLGLSYEQVVHPTGDVDSSEARVTEHHETQRSAVAHWLGARERFLAVGDDGRVNGVRVGTAPREVPQYPVVRKLPRVVARASERAVATVGNPWPSLGAPAMLTVRALVAPTDEPDRVFIGHSGSLPRGPKRDKNAARTEQRDEARQQRAVSETLAYLSEITDAMELASDCGAMAVALADGTDVRVTMGASGVASVRIVMPDGSAHRMKARSARAIARRVATLAG